MQTKVDIKMCVARRAGSMQVRLEAIDHQSRTSWAKFMPVLVIGAPESYLCSCLLNGRSLPTPRRGRFSLVYPWRPTAPLTPPCKKCNGNFSDLYLLLGLKFGLVVAKETTAFL